MFRDRGIVLLAIGQTLAWAGLYYSFPAMLLRWERELGWSKPDLMAAITMAVLISGLVSPLAGHFIDRGRGPSLMALSAILGGVALVFLSMVSTLWQFYAIWAIIGLAMSGCLYEPCFALVTRARGADAKRSIIFITLIAGFASTISFPLVYTLAEAYGWRTTVVCFGLLVILIVSPLLWLGARQIEFARDIDPARSTAGTDASEAFLKRPAFWFLAVGFSFVAIVHGATLHHLLPILNEYGLSSEIAVLAASFIGPMQIAGRLAMMAADKYTSNHSIAVAAFMLMGAAVLLLMLSGSSPAFLSTSIILFGGAYGTVSILRPLIAREILGSQNFGAKSGALALPYLAGSAFAPFLGALIWEIGGYDTLLSLLAGLAIIGCAMYVVSYRLAART
uniref:MFS transporter n=1 Tax=Pararhizobium sp. IMCC3301 TaxID=3067904 RepID=UPI0027408E8A|nr:MFS transporter [Pararhizobium sp. IMCC3301]